MTTIDQNKPSAVAPRAAARVIASQAAPVPVRLWVGCLLGAAALGAASGVWSAHADHNRMRVLARVNQHPIYRQKFEARLLEQSNSAAIVREMAEDELALQFAARLKVVPSAAQIEELYRQESQRPYFAHNVRETGQTPEDIKRDLAIKYARLYAATRGVEASDAEVQQMYMDNVRHSNPQAQYYLPPRAQVAVIVTGTRQGAESALEALRHGKPFALVAATFSQDASRDNGGVLPLIAKGRGSGRATGPEQTIFGMQVGDQIGPRQFGNAWWIVRCLEQRPEVTTPFSAVREECRMLTLLRKMGAAGQTKVESSFSSFETGAKLQSFRKRYNMVAREINSQK